MRYEEIQRKARIYHCRNSRDYVGKYDRYFASPKGPSKWRNAIAVTREQAEELIKFLIAFDTTYVRTKYYGKDKDQFIDSFERNLESVLRWARHLSDMALVDVDFDELLAVDSKQLSVREVMKKCYLAAGRNGSGYKPTMSSKILHVVNPELFAMWDDPIRRHYEVGEGNQTKYVDVFMTTMQRLTNRAIGQIMDEQSVLRDEAARLLNPCPSHSIVKALDEYNFITSRRS